MIRNGIIIRKFISSRTKDTWNMPHRRKTEKKYWFVKNFKTTELGCKKERCQVSIVFATEWHVIQWYIDGSKTTEGTEIGVYVPRTRYLEIWVNTQTISRQKCTPLRSVPSSISRETIADNRLSSCPIVKQPSKR